MTQVQLLSAQAGTQEATIIWKQVERKPQGEAESLFLSFTSEQTRERKSREESLRPCKKQENWHKEKKQKENENKREKEDGAILLKP